MIRLEGKSGVHRIMGVFSLVEAHLIIKASEEAFGTDDINPLHTILHMEEGERCDAVANLFLFLPLDRFPRACEILGLPRGAITNVDEAKEVLCGRESA